MLRSQSRILVTLSLVAAIFGCGDVRPGVDADVDAADDDSPAIDAPSSSGSWSYQRVENVNTTAPEGSPSVTADGLELFFYREGGSGGSDLMFSTRADATRPWSAPSVAWHSIGVVYSPEVSPDGLTLFFPYSESGGQNVHWLTRATRANQWPTTWTQPIVWPVYNGGIAFSGDGLAAYYANREIQIRVRRRSSLTATWGAEETVPGVDSLMRYRFVTVDGSETHMILSGPVITNGQLPPAVVELTRANAADAFGPYREIVSLTEPPAFEGCDMSGSPDVMWCHRDPAGGTAFDLYLVQRGI